jgi:predicted RecA/RadA family phage recombinase
MTTAGDRDNFSGDIEFTAPTGGHTKGLFCTVLDTLGVARETVAATVSGKVALKGCVWVTKVTGTGKNFAVGDKVYYESSGKKATPSATGNTLVGVALAVAATTDTAVLIDLFGCLAPTAT